MSDRQTFDFLEVAHSAFSSVLGRILGVVLSFLLGCVVVSFAIKNEFYEFGEIFGELMISLGFSIFTATGLVAFPALLLLAIGFVRYEWPLWMLLIFFGAPWLFIPPYL